MKGNGNSYDFGARMYDSRIGKFFSIDPYYSKICYESNYIFSGNNPIRYIDKNGKYQYDATDRTNYEATYPLITKYLQSQVLEDVKNSTMIIEAFKSVNPNLTDEKVLDFFIWEGEGSKTNLTPCIKFTDKPGSFPYEVEIAAGYFERGSRTIQINSKYAKHVEDVLASDASDEEKLEVFTRFYMTLIHETAHAFSQVGPQVEINGKKYWTRHNPDADYTGEDGYKVEDAIWGYENYNSYDAFSSDETYEGEYVLPPIKGYDYRVGIVAGVIENAEKTTNGQATLPSVPKPDSNN